MIARTAGTLAILLLLAGSSTWALLIGGGGFYDAVAAVNTDSPMVVVEFSRMVNDRFQSGLILLSLDGTGRVKGAYHLNSFSPLSAASIDGKVLVTGSYQRSGALLLWNPRDGPVMIESNASFLGVSPYGESFLVAAKEDVNGSKIPLLISVGWNGEMKGALKLSLNPGMGGLNAGTEEGAEIYDVVSVGSSAYAVGGMGPGLFLLRLDRGIVRWAIRAESAGVMLEPQAVAAGHGTVVVAGVARYRLPRRSDGFLASFSEDGDLIDFQLVGGRGYNEIYSVRDTGRGFVASGMGGCFLGGGCDLLLVWADSKGSVTGWERIGTEKVERANDVLPLGGSVMLVGSSEGEVTRSPFYALALLVEGDGTSCMPINRRDLNVTNARLDVAPLQVRVAPFHPSYRRVEVRLEREKGLEIWNPCSFDPYLVKGLLILAAAAVGLLVVIAILSKRAFSRSEPQPPE